VDDDHALAAEDIAEGVEFEADAGFANALVGMDEGTADVTVLDEAFAIGNAGLAGVADGGGNGRIRDADDDIGIDGMFAGEGGAHLFARLVNELATDAAVGAGEVGVFEGAGGAPAGGGNGEEAGEALSIDLDDFTRHELAFEGKAEVFEGAGFGGDDPTIGGRPRAAHAADAEGPDGHGV